MIGCVCVANQEKLLSALLTVIIHNHEYNLNNEYILLTKTTAAQTEDALSYYRVRGLYFLAAVFVATIV